MAKAKFIDKEVVFQEVPGEISMCYYITNCPHQCEGCHSPALRKDIGESLFHALKCNDLQMYKESGMIPCILFMGGDNCDDIVDCLKLARSFGFKTALYSGNTIETFNKDLLKYLDYIKVGPYIKELGGLDSKSTNQRMYKNNGGNLVDITYKFQKSY